MKKRKNEINVTPPPILKFNIPMLLIKNLICIVLKNKNKR